MNRPAFFRKLMIAAVVGVSLVTASCATGPVRRVSDPAANLQQITVQPNGKWSVALRLQNYSSIPMRFQSTQLKMTIEGQEAATIALNTPITIGPESPDVVTLSVVPTLAGKSAVAESLTRRTTLNYKLQGTITATPEGARVRTFNYSASSSLSPTPGLDGVLR